MTSASPLVSSLARGALTSERYLESLDDNRDVWLDGKRVDVTRHDAFAGLLAELGRLYDLQHDPELQDQMTFVSVDSGNRVSLSYLPPTTTEELRAKRRNSEIWSSQSWGQLARVPDFMANVMVGIYDFRHQLAVNDARFGANVERYFSHCQQNDVALTHSIVDPQIDRSSGPADDPDMALRVIRETAEGIVVRGAKQLATLAPVSNEILVYLSASYAQREHKEFVSWFALPLSTPGLTVLCREPFSHTGDGSRTGDGHAHPFASRYDEPDAMVFFDDVLVPWHRVFLLYDSPLALRGLQSINAWSLYTSQIRFHQRILAFVGVTTMIAEAIGVHGFREIREKLGELVGYAEMVRLGLSGMEADAFRTENGLLSPGSDLPMSCMAAQIAPRLIEILREIGASGLIMQPSEADLAEPHLRPFLETYMRGHDIDVDRKSRLFRLAWDLAGDSSGMRQDLYERWHRGDIARNRINLYLRYDRSHITDRINELISNPF